MHFDSVFGERLLFWVSERMRTELFCFIDNCISYDGFQSYDLEVGTAALAIVFSWLMTLPLKRCNGYRECKGGR